VETLVAILVFGAVVGVLLEVTAQSLTMGKRSEFAYTAYSIAKNHIETLKALPFSDAASAAESDVRVNSLGVPDDSGAFSRTSVVTPNYSSDSSLVLIAVSVDYMIKGAFVNKPTTISTVIFEYA
jgi:hypothetical protein